MRRKKSQKKALQERKKTHRIELLFLGVIILAAFLVSSRYLLGTNSSRIASVGGRDNLQLDYFIPTKTPTPIPTLNPTPTSPPPVDVCNHHDDGTAVDPSCFCPQYLVKCEGGQCVDYNRENSGLKDRDGHPFSCEDTHPPAWSQNWCQPPIGNPDGWNCLGKPVVYLYPTHPMFVDVSVETPGEIIASDPTYPTNGWKNVFAYPTGELIYENSLYRELFYESAISDVQKPETGITLKSEKLTEQLEPILIKLGLIKNEREEFLDWWVPKLQALHTPYVFFSIISAEEKNRLDRVIITPEPDTRIEFIAYFGPLEKPYDGPKLQFPETPQRIGFTAVEWGGTIVK